MVLLIQDILHDEEPVAVLKKGFQYVGFLVISMVVYYLISQLLLLGMGTPFNAYASGALDFSLKMIPERMITAYVTFVRFFTWGTRALIPTSFSRWVHVGLLCSCFLLVILGYGKKLVKEPVRLILLVFLGIMLPLAINCMFLITPETSVHTLVLYGFVSVYVLALVAMDSLMNQPFAEKSKEFLRSTGLNLATVCLVLILTVNTYVANQSFLNMQLRYENAYSFFSTVIAGLQQNEEFTPETKLALVGEYQDPWFYPYYFSVTYDLAGVTGFVPTDYSNQAFITYFMGVDIAVASEEEVSELKRNQQVQDMSVYPYSGSIKRVGDYMVVRLS